MEPTPLFIALVVVFVLLSLLLIVIILIQQRTKGGMSSVFGGGGGGGGTGAEQIFGSSGVAPVLTKVTAVLGGVFMALSLALVLISSSGQPGVEDGAAEQQPQNTAPIPRDLYQSQEAGANQEGQLMIDTTGSGGN